MIAPGAAASVGHAFISALIRRGAGYVGACGLVAAATAASAAIEAQAPHAQVSLVFVLPVVVAAAIWGWGPSLLATLLGAGAFDFVFTEPRFTFRIDQPAEIVTLVLLLVVAALASASAAQARRSALQARRAAKHADALHDLARSTLAGADAETLLRLGQVTLERCFGVPAVVLRASDDRQVKAPGSGERHTLSGDDLEAARWAMEHGACTRAADYPFFGSRFDFWPGAGGGLAFGLMFGLTDDRPHQPGELIELVAGYLIGADARLGPTGVDARHLQPS